MRTIDQWTALLEDQLAIDYGCTAEEVRGSAHVFRPLALHENRRRNGWSGEKFAAAVYRSKLLVMAEESLAN